ncbi:MAG TPA: DUF3617 domain-containing protein [Allosphingosinicella sp.]|nr:DUF3617 domain-containing protein [Allosphingosinicella sp.]
MRKLALIVLLAAAGCGAGTQQAEAPAEIKLQPGQWEMTTEITNLAVPQSKQAAAKPITISNCITADQIDRPQPSIFASSKGNCSYDNFYMSNGHLNGSVKCALPDGAGSVATSIDGSYTASTMTASVQTMNSVGGVANSQMSAKLSGRRIGECTTPPAEPAKP